MGRGVGLATYGVFGRLRYPQPEAVEDQRKPLFPVSQHINC
jgi:hypothetical protein